MLTLSSNFCMLGIKNTDSAKIPIWISDIENPPKNTQNPNFESKLGTKCLQIGYFSAPV